MTMRLQEIAFAPAAPKTVRAGIGAGGRGASTFHSCWQWLLRHARIGIFGHDVPGEFLQNRPLLVRNSVLDQTPHSPMPVRVLTVSGAAGAKAISCSSTGLNGLRRAQKDAGIHPLGESSTVIAPCDIVAGDRADCGQIGRGSRIGSPTLVTPLPEILSSCRCRASGSGKCHPCPPATAPGCLL